MTTRMLIDARHQEETRVAVVQGGRIEEFDFESAEHKQLKGNIYLAKVTRVEPSLQAAFIDFGGNRHGFLAFSEIHPDYYQIPKEDRDALLREEAAHAAEEEALRAEEDEHDDGDEGPDGDPDLASAERFDDDGGHEPLDSADEHPHEGDDGAAPQRRTSSNGGDESAAEALRKRRTALRRRYKIQDVIRRRQVLLVQVVKEERGNKGAALTTYLSLAGRYCVLMPNTTHGGGISRKISNGADRKRLKSIMAEMKLPPSMGCIVRTAGLQRTKAEIRRDFDYLARLWDGIREDTLKSAAPALIYGDSDLIKRAIRDIYSREIDEVIVEGERGYRAARDFMKMLMPSHVRKIAAYVDAVPLYQRYGVEDQLSAMYQPLVQLKSGGYLVINPTEALVSIDINSGRSTREHNIEQTATATNLEAAAEIARQLRLRDMAGLVVIDFIDMENGSNVRKVEKAMKEALKNDRARIQIGRISSFGLMEMSRQRLRTGVLEASTRICPHCEGTGFIRTASSAGLSALRLLEDEAARGRGSQLCLRASQEASIYVLNRKRGELAEIEERYGVHIEVLPDGHQDGARMSVDVGGPPPEHAPRIPVLQPIEDEDDDLPFEEDEIDEEEESEDEARGERQPRNAEQRGEDDGRGGRRPRRRRRRRGGRREEGAPFGEEGEARAEDAADGADADGADGADDAVGDEAADREAPRAGDDGQDEARPRRGRRGRRGGRGRSRPGGGEGDGLIAADGFEQAIADEVTADEPEAVSEAPPELAAEAEAEPKPRARRRPRARTGQDAVTEAPAAAAPVAEETPVEEPAAKPKRARRKAVVEEVAADETVAEPAPAAAEPVAAAPARRGRAKAAPVEQSLAAEAPLEENAANDAEPDGEPRRGWWQRTFGN